MEFLWKTFRESLPESSWSVIRVNQRNLTLKEDLLSVKLSGKNVRFAAPSILQISIVVIGYIQSGTFGADGALCLMFMIVNCRYLSCPMY